MMRLLLREIPRSKFYQHMKGTLTLSRVSRCSRDLAEAGRGWPKSADLCGYG